MTCRGSSGKLTEELVEAAVGKAFETFRLAGGRYRKGALTGEECRRNKAQAFCGVFMGLFTDNMLELRLSGKNYTQFKKEYDDYLKGYDTVNQDHIPWLFDTQDGPREAHESDRKQFFRLMELFRIFPGYFEPVPENVPAPGKVYVHTYNSSSVCAVPFSCADDGGLLADADAAGRTYRLRNGLGLEAVLTVVEDRRRAGRKGLDFDEMVFRTDKGAAAMKAEFLAEGHIEGYTARERKGSPEILIRLEEGGRKVGKLAYREDPDDAEAYRNHPLWQEYFRWCGEMEKRRDRMLEPLFDGFMRADDI